MIAVNGQRKFGARTLLSGAAIVLLFAVGSFASIRRAGDVLRNRYAAPGRMVSLDAALGTHRLHLYCTGKGEPAIVIESGLGTDWVSWQLVTLDLAARNRVCVYDRAGYGWSEPGPRPRTALRLALELHSLLDRGGVPGPYVLVAHSFGSHVARLFAARFPGSLKGLVL